MDTYEQVAEFQGMSDPDQLGYLAFITACYYNGAMIAPDQSRWGWGFAVLISRCRRCAVGQFKGPAIVKPKLYHPPSCRDRISKKVD